MGLLHVTGMQALPSSDEVHGALQRVLSVPPFTAPAPGPLRQLLSRISKAIDDLKYWALHQFSEWLGIGGVDRWLVVGVIVALSAALLYGAVRVLLRPRAGNRAGRVPSGLSAAALVMPLVARRLNAARELASERRFDEAMDALYQGACLWLDDCGHARYEDEKTGGDYAREIASSELRVGFRRLLAGFYPVAYGGRSASLTTWERMRTAATELGVPL